MAVVLGCGRGHAPCGATGPGSRTPARPLLADAVAFVCDCSMGTGGAPSAGAAHERKEKGEPRWRAPWRPSINLVVKGENVKEISLIIIGKNLAIGRLTSNEATIIHRVARALPACWTPRQAPPRRWSVVDGGAFLGRRRAGERAKECTYDWVEAGFCIIIRDWQRMQSAWRCEKRVLLALPPGASYVAAGSTIGVICSRTAGSSDGINSTNVAPRVAALHHGARPLPAAVIRLRTLPHLIELGSIRSPVTSVCKPKWLVRVTSSLAPLSIRKCTVL
eukprot:scaffold185555_cov34-Tisochrysis_lutea.AAC.4